MAKQRRTKAANVATLPEVTLAESRARREEDIAKEYAASKVAGACDGIEGVEAAIHETHFHAVQAWLATWTIIFGALHREQGNAQEWLSRVLLLDLHTAALAKLWRGAVKETWPTDPGVSVAMWAGESAADLAQRVAGLVVNATAIARLEAIGCADADGLIVAPDLDERLSRWRGAVAAELQCDALAGVDWPRWKMHRDRDAVLQKLASEHNAAQAAVPRLTPTEARNKYCYEAWTHGDTLSEINGEVKRHLGWEQFEYDSSVRSAIQSWANRFNPPLPIRKGQPGRKPASA